MYILSLILLYLTINKVHSLVCFDSGSPKDPGVGVNCSDDELCYSEFYSISARPETKRVSEWHVDRFCVHRDQCLRRGIGPDRCVNMSKLDPVVQKTFTHKINQKHSANTHKRLVRAEFCCCQKDYCNRLDIAELKKRYNISISNGSEKVINLNVTVFVLLFGILIRL